MTDVAAQQGYGLSAPSSRQDIVSALLSDYGNSFGHDDFSPSAYSPVPADKDLPPPPPRSDSLRNKPLPAVQRAEQRMSMKFQLRVIEDAPLSPSSVRRDPSSPAPRKKILYRSLSREGKPPSLNLVTSNGSTAVVPPTPALSARAPLTSTSSNYDTKDLPSPPPPPPMKSERRSHSAMGVQQSKPQKELTRNDSLLSPNELKSVQTERPATVESTVVKRKAVAAGAKKFMSLAALGTGPRGGKGGPLPPTFVPRKATVDNQGPSQEEDTRGRQRGIVGQADQQDQPSSNQLPPTPEDDKINASVPAPPRKPIAALGLPSNPRSKGGPISPKHVRGKSSTGFSLLKAQRPAPPPPNMKVNTITPEQTPSPTLKPEAVKEQEMSPLSPLPPAANEQSRPFSFEVLTVPKPSVQPQQPLRTLNTKTPNPATPSITIQTAPQSAPKESPIRPTSLDLEAPSPPLAASHPAPTPSPKPASIPAPILKEQPFQAGPTVLPQQLAQPVEPVQPAQQIQPPQLHPSLQSAPTQNPSSPPDSDDLPPFTPLTRAPIPLPTTLIPAITTAHLQCYTSHRHFIWSNNTFQPMGCMVCRENTRDRKWCCAWCQLRICVRCSEELGMVGGDLGLLMDERAKRVKDVLSDVDEGEEDWA